MSENEGHNNNTPPSLPTEKRGRGRIPHRDTSLQPEDEKCDHCKEANLYCYPWGTGGMCYYCHRDNETCSRIKNKKRPVDEEPSPVPEKKQKEVTSSPPSSSNRPDRRVKFSGREMGNLRCQHCKDADTLCYFKSKKHLGCVRCQRDGNTDCSRITSSERIPLVTKKHGSPSTKPTIINNHGLSTSSPTTTTTTPHMDKNHQQNNTTTTVQIQTISNTPSLESKRLGEVEKRFAVLTKLEERMDHLDEEWGRKQEEIDYNNDVQDDRVAKLGTRIRKLEEERISPLETRIKKVEKQSSDYLSTLEARLNDDSTIVGLESRIAVVEGANDVSNKKLQLYIDSLETRLRDSVSTIKKMESRLAAIEERGSRDLSNMEQTRKRLDSLEARIDDRSIIDTLEAQFKKQTNDIETRIISTADRLKSKMETDKEEARKSVSTLNSAVKKIYDENQKTNGKFESLENIFTKYITAAQSQSQPQHTSLRTPPPSINQQIIEIPTQQPQQQRDNQQFKLPPRKELSKQHQLKSSTPMGPQRRIDQ